MRLIFFGFLAMSLAASTSWRAWSSEQNCQDLVTERPDWGGILKPRWRMDQLKQKMSEGKRVKIKLGTGIQVVVYLESRTLARGGPPQLVVVKRMGTAEYAHANARGLRNYKKLKQAGLLDGFDVVEVLAEGPNWNIFPFEEGRVLSDLGGYRWGFGYVSVEGSSPIWDEYKRRLNVVRANLEAHGMKAVIDHGALSQSPAALEAWNAEGDHILQISAANLLVTPDGRFIIFDPL